jgi:hypothetical protein
MSDAPAVTAFVLVIVAAPTAPNPIEVPTGVVPVVLNENMKAEAVPT